MAVDIILPTYKRGDLLVEALKSVQQQSYREWRCWIAEDGHSEATSKAIKLFLADKRFEYLPGEHSGAPAAPRNRAIKAGKADYIAILDDDDIWLPEKLQYQVDFMDKHLECAMVGANGYIWSGRAIKHGEELPLYHEKVPEGEVSLKKLLQDNCFIGSGTLIRRKNLSKSGLFNTELIPPLGEDYELWLRLAATGSLWFLVKPLLYFRVIPENKYYGKKLSKIDSYKWKTKILSHALSGFQGCRPFQEPSNKHLYKQVKKKLNRLSAGPGVLGLLKYLIRGKYLC